MADQTGRGNMMASATALKAAKKELRSLMKQKLSAVSEESIDAQSNLDPACSKSGN